MAMPTASEAIASFIPSRTESGRTPETVFTELMAWSLPLIDNCYC
jgi:hypothetical protein